MLCPQAVLMKQSSRNKNLGGTTELSLLFCWCKTSNTYAVVDIEATFYSYLQTLGFHYACTTSYV